MTRLTTHPRRGLPAWLDHVAFEGGAAGADGGGGGNPPADPPKEKGANTEDSGPPAQEGKETDWKREARKWEDRAKENSKAADENKALKERLDKLSPLEKLAAALGADTQAGPTDVDKLTERVTDFEKTLAEERTARFRAEVANEKKLSAEQAKYLTGSTKDEMAASADALLAAFPQTEQAPGNPLLIRQSGTGDGAPAAGSVDKGREMYRAEQAKRQKAPELQSQN